MPNQFNPEPLKALLSKIESNYTGIYNLRASQAISYLNQSKFGFARHAIREVPTDPLTESEKEEFVRELVFLETEMQIQQEEREQASYDLDRANNDIATLRIDSQLWYDKSQELELELTTKTEQLTQEQTNTQALQARLTTLQIEKDQKEAELTSQITTKQAELDQALLTSRASTANLRAE